VLCLHCHQDGLPLDTKTCPQCGVYLPALLQSVLPPGTVLASKYRIDYALGRGGFGITYRATHTGLEQMVAIKEYFPQDQATRTHDTREVSVPTAERETYSRGLSRFVREGRILAQLDHPGVVRVRDLLEERNTAYLVMDLVPGRTLRTELEARAGQPLAHEEVWSIFTQIAMALRTLHDNNVLHLDIKPENVLITPQRKAVLIDFGAARQGLGSTSSSLALTVPYAPEELLAGTGIGPESDLFELGVLVFELLTGRLPPNVLQRRITPWEPSGFEEPWQSILSRLLALQRDGRPESVVVLAQIANEVLRSSKPQTTPTEDQRRPVTDPPVDRGWHDIGWPEGQTPEDQLPPPEPGARWMRTLSSHRPAWIQVKGSILGGTRVKGRGTTWIAFGRERWVDLISRFAGAGQKMLGASLDKPQPGSIGEYLFDKYRQNSISYLAPSLVEAGCLKYHQKGKTLFAEIPAVGELPTEIQGAVHAFRQQSQTASLS